MLQARRSLENALYPAVESVVIRVEASLVTEAMSPGLGVGGGMDAAAHA